jgi:hypothetical protein
MKKYAAYDPTCESISQVEHHDTWLEAACAAMSYDGYAWQCREITAEDLPDESHYKIGEHFLWVKSTHHGNNSYEPEGIRHRDATGISGSSVEECLKQYEKRGKTWTLHPRLNIVVQEIDV